MKQAAVDVRAEFPGSATWAIIRTSDATSRNTGAMRQNIGVAI
jgi:hypothetical protein